MYIAIGADHRGFGQKAYIQKTITDHQWIDAGAYNQERSDYPIFANNVCQYIKTDKAERGILLCGTGIGMAIAANRFSHIYAALVWNKEIAIKSREDDWSNILVLPSDYLLHDEVITIIYAWLDAKPKGGRYQ